MKILFWVPYPTQGPSNRYRVQQYLPYLDREGIRYALRPFWLSPVYACLHKKGHFLKKSLFFLIGTANRIIDLLFLYRYDLIFIHREAFPLRSTFFEAAAKSYGKKIIFDFDDSIFLSNVSEANKPLNFLKDYHKIAKIIKLSDLVIAGNKFLKEYALKYNQNCIVIPTVVDTEKYRLFRPSPGKQDIVIGWVGSFSTIKYLNLIKDVLEELLREFSQLKVIVTGGDFPSENSRISSRPWRLEREVSDLMEFDIGIMPMTDDDWGRGKCAFKILQYMALGIPAVASPVGMNAEVIQDGVNGFLPKDKKEWHERLSLLITDAELRQRLGRAGRLTIEERYSLKAHTGKFIAALKSI